MLEPRWGPGPWPADGAASFVLRPRRERARRARGLHLARAPTQPARGYSSRRGLAALWPSPRARCRPGFLTLGRRRTPAPIREPAAPSTLSALAPFKPSSQVPRRAHSETRVPYRESTAPSPSRRRPHPSARGRGQNERLVSPHETKKAPPLPPSEGKPSARARLSRPPHAARAPAARALVTSPPPTTDSLSRFRRRPGLLRVPAHPSAPSARARPPRVGWGRWVGPERPSAPDAPPHAVRDGPAPARGGLRPRHAARLHAAGHAQSGWHCGGCGGGGGWERLGDGVAARSEEKGWPRDPETRK